MAGGLKLKQRTVSFFGYAGAGIAYVIVAGLVLTGLSMIAGIQSEGGLITITELTSAFVNLEPLGIIIGLVSFIILGALIWVFGIIGVKIRRAVGADDEEIKFSKRPFILAFFLAGVIAVVVFATLSAILDGITQDTSVDLTNVASLFDAVATGNPMLFIGVIIGLAIIGFLVIKIARVERKLGETFVPDKAQI